MRVALVSPERELWTGTATEVYARTMDGELGIMAGHIPLLGVLAEGGVVRITTTEGHRVTAAVHGGFLSVTNDGVSILAETAELAEEIDAERARAALAGAEAGSTDAQRAEGRLRAVDQG
ncbi:MAG TPA: F0F1 ATP synthase subunit epsilon [Mycobacteriales bacterium]|jgi:F-type H+-transporting ATPase subunit epsilon|nr:F0F1 ATP synthase subunit epsilon [Mycobacteriales bacterium]